MMPLTCHNDFNFLSFCFLFFAILDTLLIINDVIYCNCLSSFFLYYYITVRGSLQLTNIFEFETKKSRNFILTKYTQNQLYFLFLTI